MALAGDQLGQVQVAGTGEVVEAVGVTGEDEDLQPAGGWAPGAVALGGQVEDIEKAAILGGVGVSERVIQDGDHWFGVREDPTQGQAHQQAQLFAGAIGFIVPGDGCCRRPGLEQDAFRHVAVAEANLAVLVQADLPGSVQNAAGDGAQNALDLALLAFLEQDTEPAVSVGFQFFTRQGRHGFLQRRLGVGHARVQALVAL
jgi:hypothetical protein